MGFLCLESTWRTLRGMEEVHNDAHHVFMTLPGYTSTRYAGVLPVIQDTVITCILTLFTS
jgi:hypothetical protein